MVSKRANKLMTRTSVSRTSETSFSPAGTSHFVNKADKSLKLLKYADLILDTMLVL